MREKRKRREKFTPSLCLTSPFLEGGVLGNLFPPDTKIIVEVAKKTVTMELGNRYIFEAVCGPLNSRIRVVCESHGVEYSVDKSAGTVTLTSNSYENLFVVQQKLGSWYDVAYSTHMLLTKPKASAPKKGHRTKASMIGVLKQAELVKRKRRGIGYLKGKTSCEKRISKKKWGGDRKEGRRKAEKVMNLLLTTRQPTRLLRRKDFFDAVESGVKLLGGDWRSSSRNSNPLLRKAKKKYASRVLKGLDGTFRFHV